MPDKELSQRVEEVRKRVAFAAERSGREADAVSIMAVTKTVPAQRVNQAIDCGLKLLGENRVQEYLEKLPLYHKEDCSVHFIGSLQTNKVKYIIDKVDMIESVNSLRLAREIEKRAAAAQKVMDFLLEVNIGEEATKSGVLPQDLAELAKEVSQLPHLRFSGLMAIPPAGGDASKKEYYFSKMYQLFLDMKQKKLDNSDVRFLSMGMSNDFESAILCGSNLVRLGTILFGKRNYREEQT